MTSLGDLQDPADLHRGFSRRRLSGTASALPGRRPPASPFADDSGDARSEVAAVALCHHRSDRSFGDREAERSASVPMTDSGSSESRISAANRINSGLDLAEAPTHAGSGMIDQPSLRRPCGQVGPVVSQPGSSNLASPGPRSKIRYTLPSAMTRFRSLLRPAPVQRRAAGLGLAVRRDQLEPGPPWPSPRGRSVDAASPRTVRARPTAARGADEPPPRRVEVFRVVPRQGRRGAVPIAARLADHGRRVASAQCVAVAPPPRCTPVRWPRRRGRIRCRLREPFSRTAEHRGSPVDPSAAPPAPGSPRSDPPAAAATVRAWRRRDPAPERLGRRQPHVVHAGRRVRRSGRPRLSSPPSWASDSAALCRTTGSGSLPAGAAPASRDVTGVPHVARAASRRCERTKPSGSSRARSAPAPRRRAPAG